MYPNVNLLICAAKYGLKGYFLCLLVALALFGTAPQLTYLNFGQYVDLMVNLGC